jgi:deazaflavin-dependent oxidoreductase (nitroreductase family)
MARTYHLSAGRRLANRLLTALLRRGVAGGMTYLLTVRGRRSGRPYSTPVNLIEHGAERWLVAPYGAVNWVRNARAAGQVTLSRGRHSETVGIRELGPEESAPVLKEYVRRVPITRPYFDATPQSPVEVFAAEAGRHPVFHIGGPVAA